MKSQSFLHLGRWLMVLAFLATLCVASVATRQMTPSSTGAPEPTLPSIISINPSIPAASTPFSTTPASADTMPPATASPVVDPDLLAGITMTSVPRNVIVPTNADSLDEVTNPINGRRGGRRDVPEHLDCVSERTGTCLTDTLDMLGFDVTSGSSDDLERRVQRATAVVQLDAGLPMNGVPDDDLLEYLGITTDTTRDADEVRQIGTSATERPIMALRYGNGPRTVLVVGVTHGDEEGGLRVLLRARTLSLSEEITLWVIPIMNPDGLALDTRFLANGADPNRQAPIQREQLAVYDFALATRPSLTVWYHQNYGWVGASGASITPATRYHSITGLGSLHHSGDCAKGFMWCPIDDALGSSSILVELPDVLTPADVRIHALALLAVASDDAL